MKDEKLWKEHHRLCAEFDKNSICRSERKDIDDATKSRLDFLATAEFNRKIKELHNNGSVTCHQKDSG